MFLTAVRHTNQLVVLKETSSAEILDFIKYCLDFYLCVQIYFLCFRI